MHAAFRHILQISLLLLPVTLTAADASSDEPEQAFSHQLFDEVLSTSVNDGHVDYISIMDDARYSEYLQQLEHARRFENSNHELSYWINAYNALAIKGILDGRSPESFFGKIGYFYNAEYTVNGIRTNLYDLEHEIIIPLGEPRIHFALNCASASCPVLIDETYKADELEAQLEAAAIRFINDDTRNRFDKQTRTAYLSKIFDWFAADFINHSGSVQSYLALYVKDEDISNTLADNAYNIEFMEYDWSLNGTPPDPTDDKR